eukprot:scaffold2510_cov169-Amphora_coffeaeformis.AAC.62
MSDANEVERKLKRGAAKLGVNIVDVKTPEDEADLIDHCGLTNNLQTRGKLRRLVREEQEPPSPTNFFHEIDAAGFQPKLDARKVNNFEWQMMVHVEDKEQFAEFVAWKGNETQRQWDQYNEVLANM